MNKEEKAAYMKIWRKNNRARCNAHSRRYWYKKRYGIILPIPPRNYILPPPLRRKNLTEEERKEKRKIYWQRYEEKYPERVKKQRKRQYKKRKLRQRKYMKNYFMKIKLEVFRHYSPELKCNKCGFSDLRALQIDHIFGGGVTHLKKTNGRLYPWIIKNNFPVGFQVLCANCNWIKRFENNEVRGRGNKNEITIHNQKMEIQNQPTQSKPTYHNMWCDRKW